MGDVAQKAHKAKKAYDTAKSANDVKGMKSAIQEGVDVLKAEGRAEVVSGRSVASRINIANGRTAYTPLRSNGHPVSAVLIMFLRVILIALWQIIGLYLA